MPNYRINEDGSKTILSRYAFKDVRTLASIFPMTQETSKKYLKRKKGYEKFALQKKYRFHDSSELVRAIFTTFLLKVLARVADGDLFIMPGSTRANIALKQIPDKEVRKLRQMGRFADYDIVKAGFKIPRFALDFGPNCRRKDLGIYVPPTLMQRALRNAENRQIPWIYLPKTYNKDV
jgi:hypothetical protein